MKKFLRKLLPTIVMLAVSATLVGTSTFAWFSMNNKVTVTGMLVRTKVSSNLLIAPDELSSTGKLDDSYFTNSLNKSIKAFLEPASTPDAKTYFYTTNAKADGSVNSGATFTQYDSSASTGSDASLYGDLFSQTYGITKSDATGYKDEKAVPYVDYVFQLKASNTEDTDSQYIYVEELKLQYKGAEPKGAAFRVAFFINDISSGSFSAGPQGSSSTFKIESSANFDETGSSATPGKVVASSGGYADAVYVNTKTYLAKVDHGTTKYYKVVVRLWLEGQDTSCNNETYMSLDQNWELGIKLTLGKNYATEAAQYINQINSSAPFVA